MRLATIALLAILPFDIAHARSPAPVPADEICDDDLDNDGDGLIDQESPLEDGHHRYEFTIYYHNSCTVYPGGDYYGKSCMFTETLEIDPHVETTFAFTSQCGPSGTVNVEAWATRAGEMSFDVWSSASPASNVDSGTLCDGDLSSTYEPWVTGGTGTFWVGDYELSGSTKECHAYWQIDVVPLQ